MGRSLQACLVVSAMLGFSGCLLFTDPINRPPEVTDVRADRPVIRGEAVGFTATYRDDQDSRYALELAWAVFDVDENDSCSSISKAHWAHDSVERTSRPSDIPYTFKTDTLEHACVCVQAKDRHGATGFGCQRVVPANPELIAKIADVSGVASTMPRRLCSAIHLSAEPSSFIEADQPRFTWRIEYSGQSPLGSTVQLDDCRDDVLKPNSALAGLDRCFTAPAPGTYTVHMSITVTPAGGGGQSVTSKEAELAIPVGQDRPPCLQRTTPDISSQLVMLSRSSGLGSAYESRTFKVWSVDDDCEPYPQAPGRAATQFVWSVYDETRDPPGWAYPTYSGDSFVVNQTAFPNALPGDVIKVRVEVRDQAAQEQALMHNYACADSVDVCTGDSGCIRWTTWMVQFQP